MGRWKKLLGHPDRRVRMEAQFELVNREKGPQILQRIAVEESAETIKRLHAIWGLEMSLRKQWRKLSMKQIAESKSPTLDDIKKGFPIQQLAKSKDAMIRAEAMRMLVESGVPLCEPKLVVSLLKR